MNGLELVKEEKHGAGEEELYHDLIQLLEPC